RSTDVAVADLVGTDTDAAIGEKAETGRVHARGGDGRGLSGIGGYDAGEFPAAEYRVADPMTVPEQRQGVDVIHREDVLAVERSRATIGRPVVGVLGRVAAVVGV